MNEGVVLKYSIRIFLIGLCMSVIPCIYFNTISYASGFIIGYIINVLVFLLIIQASTVILQLQSGSIAIVAVLFIIKLVLYAIGFYSAIRFANRISIVTVFMGYFVMKVTIYITGYLLKEVE